MSVPADDTGRWRRVRFVVHGRVQGVGFRAHAAAAASGLGVSGFVRNRADGAVEGEAAGVATAVDRLLAWLRHGPPRAQVDRLELVDLPPAQPGEGFRIVR